MRQICRGLAGLAMCACFCLGGVGCSQKECCTSQCAADCKKACSEDCKASCCKDKQKCPPDCQKPCCKKT